MMYHTRIRMIGIISAVLIGIALCIPNFMQSPFPKLSLPWNQIHLGLDLQGGSFLLLQLDTDTLKKERLQSLEDRLRKALVAKGAGYLNLRIDQETSSVLFQLRAPSEDNVTHEVIQSLIDSDPDMYQALTTPTNRGIAVRGEAIDNLSKEAVTRAIEVVRKRIDSFGAVDPSIIREGDNRIVVELPGITDPDRVKKLIGTTARLTFQRVADTPTEPGVTMLNDEETKQPLPIFNQIDVDGTDLSGAGASIDQESKEWAVTFRLNSEGAEAFANVTRDNVGKRFAIVLDNKVIEAPRIISPITGGNGQITGNFTAKTASDLALLLRAGALPAPLNIIEEKTIGPALGKASIRAGELSLLAGFVLIAAFMLLFYGVFGIFADISLVINLILIMAVLSVLEATMTLAGMAGVLLTLGMSVDANILINSRIKEELKKGRSVLQAIQKGFEHAQSTIIDSNATAFLAHVMLFAFGSGPVRNFALTITIGIATTLFTALIVTPYLIMSWYHAKRPTDIKG